MNNLTGLWRFHPKTGFVNNKFFRVNERGFSKNWPFRVTRPIPTNGWVFSGTFSNPFPLGRFNNEKIPSHDCSGVDEILLGYHSPYSNGFWIHKTMVSYVFYGCPLAPFPRWNIFSAIFPLRTPGWSPLFPPITARWDKLLLSINLMTMYSNR